MNLGLVLKVSLLSGFVAAALCASAQTASPSPALNPLAFLTTHEWEAKLPDSAEGKKRKIRAHFSWSRNGHAICISNQFVTDGKAAPYIDGLYAWDPQQRAIVFWYVGADGGLTQGSVKSEGGKLIHEFREIQPDGKTAEYVARVTPNGNEAWENEILARKADGSLTQIVKVKYEMAE